MPRTMKVAQISKAGGDWELVERDIPEPGVGQVRVRVEACGICHSDVLVKEGVWPGLRIHGCRATRLQDPSMHSATMLRRGREVNESASVGMAEHCFVCEPCRRRRGVTKTRRRKCDSCYCPKRRRNLCTGRRIVARRQAACTRRARRATHDQCVLFQHDRFQHPQPVVRPSVNLVVLSFVHPLRLQVRIIAVSFIGSNSKSPQITLNESV